MMNANPISRAIDIVGLQPLAKTCGVSYQAVRKWERTGLPRTEWTGETHYAEIIEYANGGKFTKDEILQWSREQRKKEKAAA